MDEITKKNEAIWNELVQNDILCSRPKLELTIEQATAYVHKKAFYGNSLKGKKVLCLAGGGGQQSVAFALLGAEVTVVDFSAEQLKKDSIAAEKFQQNIRIIQTDMRDLSMLEDSAFDIVLQPYSINYIPSVVQVFNEVTRILKPKGIYDLMLHNPYVHGSWKDGCWGSEWKPSELWQGKGYPIWQPYQDGYLIKTADPNWNFSNGKKEMVKIQSPQEFRHTLTTVINGLIGRGFELLHFKEEVGNGYDSPPGSWEHYKSCAPPWIYIISKKKK